MRRTHILGAVALPMAISLWGSVAFAKPKKRPHPAPVATPAPTPEPEPAPVAEPAPVSAPMAAPAPAPVVASSTPSTQPVDVDSLVNEYGAIRDELFRSRAKAGVIGDAVLKTQLEVTFRYEAGRAWPLRKVTLRLDDRPVYGADSVPSADASKIFETVAAAGRHVLTARVEAVGTGEERITYATESSFGIDLPDGKLTRVELDVDETGSGPSPLAKKKEGSFDLHVRANVKAVKR